MDGQKQEAKNGHCPKKKPPYAKIYHALFLCRLFRRHLCHHLCQKTEELVHNEPPVKKLTFVSHYNKLLVIRQDLTNIIVRSIICHKSKEDLLDRNSTRLNSSHS